MRPLFRQALGDGGEPHELSIAAINRRGRTIQVRVVCTPLAANGGPVMGAILVMDEEQAQEPTSTGTRADDQ
jgi:two-component system CheB/CheR fusion protein